MDLKFNSYQLPSQPSQCTLNIKSAALSCSCASSHMVSPALGVPAGALLSWFAVVKGGVLAGEVPQSG